MTYSSYGTLAITRGSALNLIINQIWYFVHIANNNNKGAFIVCCNAAALPIYRLLIYRSWTQRSEPGVHFFAVPQCKSRRRDGNTTTATYRSTDAVDYERSLRARTALECNESQMRFTIKWIKLIAWHEFLKNTGNNEDKPGVITYNVQVLEERVSIHMLTIHWLYWLKFIPCMNGSEWKSIFLGHLIMGDHRCYYTGYRSALLLWYRE